MSEIIAKYNLFDYNGKYDLQGIPPNLIIYKEYIEKHCIAKYGFYIYGVLLKNNNHVRLTFNWKNDNESYEAYIDRIKKKAIVDILHADGFINDENYPEDCGLIWEKEPKVFIIEQKQ